MSSGTATRGERRLAPEAVARRIKKRVEKLVCTPDNCHCSLPIIGLPCDGCVPVVRDCTRPTNLTFPTPLTHRATPPLTHIDPCDGSHLACRRKTAVPTNSLASRLRSQKCSRAMTTTMTVGAHPPLCPSATSSTRHCRHRNTSSLRRHPCRVHWPRVDFFCRNAISPLANDVASRARTNVVMTAMVVIAHRHTQHHSRFCSRIHLLHTMHRTACDHWRARICWLTLLHMLRTFALRWRRLRADKKGAKGKAKKRRKLSATSQVRVDCDLLPLLLRGLDDEPHDRCCCCCCCC
jgi:hypothetical protein